MLLLDYLAGVNVNCFRLKQLGSGSEAATNQRRQGWGPGSSQKSTCFSILPPTLAGQAVHLFLTRTCPHLRLSAITSLVRGGSTLNATHPLGQAGETSKLYTGTHAEHTPHPTRHTCTHLVHKHIQYTPRKYSTYPTQAHIHPHGHRHTHKPRTYSTHIPHNHMCVCTLTHVLICVHMLIYTCMNTDTFLYSNLIQVEYILQTG